MKPGRNDPCPCGSGKKFKHCCERKAEARPVNLMPTSSELNQLIALFNSGHLAEVERQARLLTERFPESAGPWKILGVCLHQQGQAKDALTALLNAARLSANDAEVHYNLGITQASLGQLNEAVASYRRSLALKPDFAAAHNNLGDVLRNLEKLDESVKSCRRALAIKPDYAGAHQNLANALVDLGKVEEAVSSYRTALQINPNFPEAYSNLLFCLNHSESSDAWALFAESCRFAEQFEAPLQVNWQPHSNSREPERCLQIGFVSSDLRSHAVAHFFEPVLQQLAQYPQLALHAYYNHAVEDDVTLQLRTYFAHWHDIADMSDEALAQKIRADGIDILYDLTGHTAQNRLLTFARKPAPVQVSWIGYPGTTGLKAMDYYQSDRFLFPDDRFDGHFTEKIVRLPASSVFLPSKYSPPVNTLPALSNGLITFGSFNRVSKISRSVVALWAQLLRAVPNARMLLGAMSENGEEKTLIKWFAQENIAQDRLIFHVRSGMDVYLGLHHQVDICLDTFPYGGGTTTFHALWMGVPTLTLGGNTMAGWAGVSILGHVGLESFAAYDETDFVGKGVFWANNLAELSGVRAGLRERFAQSARGRPDVVATAMERAIRIMWQRWCEGLPAESFEVTLQDVNSILQKAEP